MDLASINHTLRVIVHFYCFIGDPISKINITAAVGGAFCDLHTVTCAVYCMVGRMQFAAGRSRAVGTTQGIRWCHNYVGASLPVYVYYNYYYQFKFFGSMW